MDFVIFITVVIGMVSIPILVGIFKNPGERPFTSLPYCVRAEFLKQAFDITAKDCELLRFDGFNFHHPKERPYKYYTEIVNTGSMRVTVSNPRLPHSVSWKYQRVDGGPDRRYLGNTKTMKSNRNLIRFSGTQSCTLHVYSYPSYGRNDEIDTLISKFDAFLCGSHGKGYESDFVEFKEAYEKKLSIQEKIKTTTSQLSSCDAVISAHGKIMNEPNIPDDLMDRVNMALARRLKILEELARLHQDFLEQEHQQTQAVNSAKKQRKIALSHRTIAQFS